MQPGEHVRTTRKDGRYAERFEVRAPQGSSFDGRRGVAVRVAGESVMIRLDGRRGLTAPFGFGELVRLP